MLSNVKKGQRVLLSNGVKATVVEVKTSGWSTAVSSVTIRPDGGKFKTRSYRVDGTTEPSGFNVVEVLTSGYKGTVEKLVTQIESLRQTVEDAFNIVMDEIDQMDDTATSEPDDKLTSYDFEDGRGAVAAHRHMNPEGDEGGIVADTAYVDASSRIGRGSVVFGNARVTNGSKIVDNSRVSADARIDGKTIRGAIVEGRTFRAAA